MPIEIPIRSVESLEAALLSCQSQTRDLMGYYETFPGVRCGPGWLGAEQGATDFSIMATHCNWIELPEPSFALLLLIGALFTLAAFRIRSDLLGRTARRSRRG